MLIRGVNVMKNSLFNRILSCLLALTMLLSCCSALALSAAAGDFETPIIPINPGHTHNYVPTVTKEATCTEAGETTYSCACGKASYTMSIRALGHQITFHEGVGETCTTAGNKPYYACARCGNYYVDEKGETLIADKTEVVIAAKGHRFVITEQYCLNGCGEVNPNYNPAHVHNYSVVITAPTCTEAGFTTHTCECGDSFTDTPTKALGHDYKAVVTKATGTALGYTTHSCARCSDSFIDTYTAPTGKLTLKCKARTAAAETVLWNNVKTATGYQVQISTKDGKKWDKTVTLKAGVTNTTLKSLAAGNAYKFRARFYIAKGGKNYFSPWSATLTSPTLPTGTSITKTAGGSRSFTTQWKKNTAVKGYQIQYSLKSNFSGAKIVTVKSNKTLKTTVKKLSAKKVYYVRIRTYKTISKVNYFSTWSKTMKVKTK